MAQQTLSVIYIPGLGDHHGRGQLRIVRMWKYLGVEPYFFRMNWHDNEPWGSKFARLLALVDSLSTDDGRVGLVGASAGATAVIAAYASRRDRVAGCVLISGKVNQPEAIGERYRKESPAFVEGAYECQAALATLTRQNRDRILSRYALIDKIVLRLDSEIGGAHNRTVPSIGHAITIALQITFGASSFLHFLKGAP